MAQFLDDNLLQLNQVLAPRPLSSIMELIFFKYCFCLSCVAIGKLLQMSCFVMYTKFGFLCVHQPKIAAISLRKVVFDRDEN